MWSLHGPQLWATEVSVAGTALCSKGSICRSFYIQKLLCSEGPICSEGPMFRSRCSGIFVRKVLCSECPILIIFIYNNIYSLTQEHTVIPTPVPGVWQETWQSLCWHRCSQRKAPSSAATSSQSPGTRFTTLSSDWPTKVERWTTEWWGSRRSTWITILKTPWTSQFSLFLWHLSNLYYFDTFDILTSYVRIRFEAGL